jgi:ribosomal protein S12 methylthiotransferase
MPRKPSATKDKRTQAQAIESIAFVSLGCPKNLVDSEKMLGMLAEQGLAVVPSQEADFGGADAVVVNTCGFLEASKEESLGVIKEAIAAKERGDIKRVVVAGCLVQRHRAKMLDWAPGIDAMVGVFDRDKIVEAVMGGAATSSAQKRTNSAGTDEPPKYWIAGNALVAAGERGMKTAGLTVHGKDANGIGYFEDDASRLRLTPRHYAYLRISEGCNQNCTFCTIPSIRGKMRSKGPDKIISEARELFADGAFELLLIGQDTTSYGDDIGLGSGGPAVPAESSLSKRPRFDRGLPMVLKQLSDAAKEAAGHAWLRLMYAYPTTFSDEIVDAFAELCKTGALIPYLDIPLQHASDRVLKSMRRHVTRQQQEDLILKLKAKIPGFAVRTTFISGFPGETEQDHQQLLDFVEKMRFENVGVFEYSHEEGTPAGTMEEDPKLAVPAEVKAKRRNEIMELQQRIVFERHAALAGLFDEKHPLDKNGKVRGHVTDVLIDARLKTTGKATTGVGAGGGLYQGRTTSQAPQIDGVTFVQSKDKLAPGELVRCVIVGWDAYDLVAKPVSELEKKVGLTILR